MNKTKSNIKLTKWSFIIITILSTHTVLGQTTMDKIISYDKLNFGNGYNSVTHEEFLDVIKYKNIKESTELFSEAKGNNGTLEISWAYTKDDLKKIMNLSTSIDLDIKYKGFSSSNKYKSTIYKETKFSKISETAVISASYANEPLILLNPKMKKKLVRLAKRDSIGFMKKYGDCFVSKIYTGGELYAILSFESTNAFQKKKNTKYFESVNKYAGNKLSYKSTSTEENTIENDVKKKYIKIYTSGGGDLKNIDNINKFIDYASTFKSEVRTDAYPSVLYVELTPYESLPNFPRINFTQIRDIQKKFIDNGLNLHNKISENQNLADFVISNQDMYEDSDIENAKDYIITSTQKLEEIVDFLEIVKFDFTKSDELFDDLEKLAENITFEAIIDYPFFNGKPQKLTTDVNGNFQTIYNDTGKFDGKLSLQIFGELASKDKYSGKLKIKPVVYSNSQEYKYRKKKTRGNWRGTKKWYLAIYEKYSNPYYLIRFTDVETNVIVDEIKWDGTPIKVIKNAKISFKLVNPNSYLMSLYKGRWKYYNSSSFKSGPRFTNVTRPDNEDLNAPKVVITDLDSKEEMTAELQSLEINGAQNNSDNDFTKVSVKNIDAKNKKKMILKDGYFVYKTYEETNKKDENKN